MDYKTKRTVLSSSVIISSFIVCLVCVIVLINALAPTIEELPGNTETPATATPTVSVTTPPAATTPPATSNMTPTQTYHNSPYTTAPQTTKTPDVTISVTSEPPAPTDTVDKAELIAFDAKLTAFTGSTATYTVTMTFNTTGTVKMVAVNSDRMLTSADITPNFIRSAINGINRDILSTPQSLTSGVANANTSLTLMIETGLKPVDFFVIIDTDVENGLMSESIMRQNQGSFIPTIVSSTTPTIDNDGYLVFDVILSQDATVCVQLKKGDESLGTLSEPTTDGKVSFITEYDETYAGASLIAYLQYNGVIGSDRTLLSTIPADIGGESYSGEGTEST